MLDELEREIRGEQCSVRYFLDHFVVVGEWIYGSTLYKLEKDSDTMTEDAVIENQDFKNQYYAIVLLDDDGGYEDTYDDNFKTAEEAWARWHELGKEKTGEEV